jgi:hydrogenase nickel incorporation protein HypB
MSEIKVIEIQKRVYANNDEKANLVRKDLEKNNTFMINLMSSPGSGKTTFVVDTINRLKKVFNIGVIEADIDSDVDAITVKKTGAKVMQLHSGGMCHLDAGMAKDGLDVLDYENLDFVILENIGNLICPAGYDLGQAKKVMILSVPEGHDKPLKYPKMFTKVDVLIISKIDAISFFDFNFEKVTEYAKKLNPEIKIFPVSAKTGENMSSWIEYIKNEVIQWRS